MDEKTVVKESIRNAVSEALLHETTDGHFLHSFLDKGRLSFLLEQIPVYAVMDQSLGQRGAHYVAVKLLKEALMVAEGTKGATSMEVEVVEETKREEVRSAQGLDTALPECQTFFSSLLALLSVLPDLPLITQYRSRPRLAAWVR